VILSYKNNEVKHKKLAKELRKKTLNSDTSSLGQKNKIESPLGFYIKEFVFFSVD
jgi:hypothetical protein